MMKGRPIKVFILVLILFMMHTQIVKTQIQDLKFENITTENGLPHNYVRAITQDQKGFIWVGTNYGLARYDGYSFKIFQHNPQDPYSIALKSIDILFADSKGNLWLSFSSGGIGRMDLNTERFTNYFYDSTKKYPLGSDFSCFIQDSDSDIWAASTYGIFFYNKNQDNFIRPFKKNIFETGNNKIYSLADDKCGNIWFVRENKVWVLEKKTYKLSTLGEFAFNAKLDSINFNKVYIKEKGKIWIGSHQNGLFYFDIINHNIEFFLKKVPFIECCLIDEKGNLYAVSNNPSYKLFVYKKENIKKKIFDAFPFFNTKSYPSWVNIQNDKFGNIFLASPMGLVRFNFSTGIKQFESNILIPNTISSNNIENIFIDRTDNLWISPHRKGLNKADLRQKPFKKYSLKIKDLSDIQKDKNVTSVFDDGNGHIWIGYSSNGLSIYDKKTGKHYHFLLSTNSSITSIYEDSEGYIWLGANVLSKVKCPDLKKLQADSDLTISTISNYNFFSVKKIVSDKWNNLWLAGSDGLIEFNKEKNAFINHSLLYDSLNIVSGFYRTVFIDKNQNIWTGSNSGGLCKFEKSKKSFKHYFPDQKDTRSISSSTVYAIYEDKDGDLWLGTRQGLEKFNPKTEQFEHAVVDNELYNRSIFSILPDTMGNFWMSTDIGILKYNIITKTSSLFGPADGLKNNEFSTTASFMSKSGEFFFGGTSGLISFEPANITPNPIYAKPVITNFLLSNKVISPGDTLNGRVLFEKQVWETNKITLSHFESDFTIEFSALHYSAPSKIKYQYKLEGFNSDWIHTDSKKRYASYTGLPPGSYTFVLKATNNDGLMCLPNDEVRFYITITPPFWQTWLFRVFLFSLIALIVVFYFKKRTAQLHKQKRQLEIKVKERTFDLENANAELEERQEEILQQNEEIKLQKEIVDGANANLEERQEEILQQNEQIKFQKEILEEQHAKIEKAYQELSLYENQLEEIVEERTRELFIAKQKAEESDKLKSSFLANLSHEIRTPLNAIIGFSDLLIEGKAELEKQEMFKSMIQSSADSLLNLINDILDFSKIEAGAIDIRKSPFRISKITNELHELYSNELLMLKSRHQKIIEFRIIVAKELLELVIYTDENRLKQILQNLINNAIKFTSEGFVELGIELMPDNQNLKFYVKDSGIGISQENQAFIFGRFRKIENPSSNIFRGTGIGLSICKHLSKLLGEQITVKSELGKGSAFQFTIPFLTPKMQIEFKEEQNTGTSIPDFSGKTILLVEDDDSNYILIEIFIKKTNAKVIRAIDGKEAVLLTQEIDNIDLVLLDINMPIMNGFEALKQIRLINQKINIIAQTAHAYQSEIDNIIAAGFTDYILKPINAKNLYAVLLKYI